MTTEQLAQIKELYAAGFWPEEITADFPGVPIEVLREFEPRVDSKCPPWVIRDVHQRAWRYETDEEINAAHPEYSLHTSWISKVRRGVLFRGVTRQRPSYPTPGELSGKGKGNDKIIAQHEQDKLEFTPEELVDPWKRRSQADDGSLRVKLEPGTLRSLTHFAAARGLSPVEELQRLATASYGV